MALASYTVSNYRSFADPTRVELRPLTLLFGYNSAGKSALLRALPLLAASVAPSVDGPLAMRSAAARDATFADLRSRLTRRPSLDLGVSWDDDHNPVRDVELSMLDLARSKRQVVERLRVAGNGGGQILEALLALPEDELSGELSRYELAGSSGQEALVRLDFDGLVPSLVDAGDADAQWTSVIRSVGERMRSLHTGVHWIGSVRSLPARRSSYAGPPRRLQPDGGGATDMLAYDALGDGAVLRDVAAWYEAAMAHHLEVVREGTGAAEQFYVALSPRRGDPIRIHIVDTGEGMAQVLPVIVLGTLARHGRLGASPVLAIEQPEIHLHPRAHAEVASFLCRLAAADAPPRMLVETHSENLLLRVQLAIIRGELSPDRVLVYWVKQTAEGFSL
ncbi:MAG TPA: hypothetical protein VLS89_15645, partial [Candidatus Nanopelagicales bacterium]|nr:hypothetical protein [Candidatus Nanopelagicales bacterium]